MINAPLVLAAHSSDVRSKPISEILDFAFFRFRGMFRPFQNRVEIGRLLERVRELKPETVVEIGTARGGTLFLLSCVSSPTASIVSIDLPAGLYGGGYPAWKGHMYRHLMGSQQHLHLIRGDSHQDSILADALERLGGAEIDLLFIDGDHSYAGAKSDFTRYRKYVRAGGLIVFHDIIPSAYDSDITVAPLWKEVSSAYDTSEIVEAYDQGQFGIGVLVAPKDWSGGHSDAKQSHANPPPILATPGSAA